MDEDEADEGVPQMVRGDDSYLLSNSRDTMTMKMYLLHELNPDGSDAAPMVASGSESDVRVR